MVLAGAQTDGEHGFVAELVIPDGIVADTGDGITGFGALENHPGQHVRGQHIAGMQDPLAAAQHADGRIRHLAQVNAAAGRGRGEEVLGAQRAGLQGAALDFGSQRGDRHGAHDQARQHQAEKKGNSQFHDRYLLEVIAGSLCYCDLKYTPFFSRVAKRGPFFGFRPVLRNLSLYFVIE